MSIADTASIRGYYDDSRVRREWTGTLKTLGQILDEGIDELREPFKRWPVHNSEPRETIGSQKRAIIHERDGGRCPDYEELLQDGDDVGPRPEVIVFCGRCGISAVPTVAGWVL